MSELTASDALALALEAAEAEAETNFLVISEAGNSQGWFMDECCAIESATNLNARGIKAFVRPLLPSDCWDPEFCRSPHPTVV